MTAPWSPSVHAADRGMDRDELPHLGAPLGPGSLTWRLLGDGRNLLLMQRTGVLQNMHPVVSQALLDHSNVFTDPIGRLLRSAGPIVGVVFDPPEHATGTAVRDLHSGVKGTDDAGRPYHALSPEVYYWTHATFFEALIATQAVFGTPLGEAEEERLYRESITWYGRYGMSLAPVPRDHGAFRRYWEAMFDAVLEATPVARYGIRPIPHQPPPNGALDPRAWALVRPGVVRLLPWLARVTLPERARRALGVRVSAADRLALGALARTTRTTWAVLPDALGRGAAAREADRRVGEAARRGERHGGVT